jgi:hypothetical protein
MVSNVRVSRIAFDFIAVLGELVDDGCHIGGCGQGSYGKPRDDGNKKSAAFHGN